jgi:ribosome-associated toxin RatA of RatAB toxin-antitoxin module
MNKLQIAFVTILFNFYFGNCVMAEEEKQSKSDKATALNPASAIVDPHDKNIAIKVRNDGEQIIVDANFIVPVMPQQAWAVLTDFENIPSFNPDVLSSKITGRTGNSLHVAQKSVTKYGFLNFAFESVREINLLPFEKIQERMVSGNMRKMEETTQLSPEGGQTRVTYHAVFVPGAWVPPVVGNTFIKHEAQAQFQKVVNEIIRRNQIRIARR